MLECFFHSLLVDVCALKSRWSIVLYEALLFIFSFQKRNVRGISTPFSEYLSALGAIFLCFSVEANHSPTGNSQIDQ